MVDVVLFDLWSFSLYMHYFHSSIVCGLTVPSAACSRSNSRTRKVYKTASFAVINSHIDLEELTAVSGVIICR